MDTVLGIELYSKGQELPGLLEISHQAVHGGCKVGESLILALPTTPAAQRQRLIVVAPVALVDCKQERILIRRSCLRHVLATNSEIAARPLCQVAFAGLVQYLLEEPARFLPLVLMKSL